MSNYRRSKVPGASYFFTLVTHNRRPLLTEAESREALRQTISEVREGLPFKVDAWVLLPDHMHCIWSLPKNDSDYSKRWGLIKSGFTKKIGSVFHQDKLLSDSRKNKRESAIWQRRFWEHQIRDEADYQRHIDYIHYNPVKHGLVSSVKSWPYSTFHRYIKNGTYPDNWAGSDNVIDWEIGE